MRKRFEVRIPLSLPNTNQVLICYQLVIAGPVAQSGERRSVTAEVVSSKLNRTANHGTIAQLGERLLCKQDVVGSNPSGSTNYLKKEVSLCL